MEAKLLPNLDSRYRIKFYSTKIIRIFVTMKARVLVSFSVAISDLEAGKTHYIRSFAQNSAGIIFGSVKRIKLETEYSAPFDGLEVANGWYRSPWLGMFKKANSNWVFHPELGWIYHGDDHSNGTWVWIESFGWSWSRGDLWPTYGLAVNRLGILARYSWRNPHILGLHDQSIIRW